MNKVTCPNCSAENAANARYCNRCGHELPKVEFEPVVAETKPTATSDNKKKLTGTIVGVLAFFATYYLVQQLFFKTPSYDKQMMEAASELNKNCPIMVDQNTRFDNAVAMPGNTLQYNYSLVNNSKMELNVDTLRKYTEPNILFNVKTNPGMKLFRDHETTIIYYYKDKNGEFVFDYKVTPEMYQ